MIRVESLSKEYLIPPFSTIHKLCDIIIFNQLLFRQPKLLKPRFSRKFLAISDISFQVQSGEIIGIMGLNGSGKSTLLKLLTGSLVASSGHLHVPDEGIEMIDNTRVIMDDDITVHDCITTNLSTYSRSDRKLWVEKILSFFDLRDRVDARIGTLSLGTKSRLLFGIATSTQKPVILLDEILGSGDPYWNERCFQWLKLITAGDKIVIMTSHNTQLLQRYCDLGLWVDAGTVKASGSIDVVARAYESQALSLAFTGVSSQLRLSKDIVPSGARIASNLRLQITSVQLIYSSGVMVEAIDRLAEPLHDIPDSIRVNYHSNVAGTYWPTVIITFWGSSGIRLMTVQNQSYELVVNPDSSPVLEFELPCIDISNTISEISISLFNTAKMLTSNEDLTREDYLHKFCRIVPSTILNGKSIGSVFHPLTLSDCTIIDYC
jgi:ABC-type polysaccharide/polyol phosphate transport system ATPase subunit